MQFISALLVPLSACTHAICCSLTHLWWHRKYRNSLSAARSSGAGILLKCAVIGVLGRVQQSKRPHITMRLGLCFLF